MTPESRAEILHPEATAVALRPEHEQVRLKVATTAVAELQRPKRSPKAETVSRSAASPAEQRGAPSVVKFREGSQAGTAPSDSAGASNRSATPPRRKRGPPPSLASLADYAVNTSPLSTDQKNLVPSSMVTNLQPDHSMHQSAINAAEIQPIVELYSDANFSADGTDRTRQRSLRQVPNQEYRERGERQQARSGDAQACLCSRAGRLGICTVFLLTVVISMAVKI
eukprot:SAG31_NODE_6493_length_1997_cov_2.064805_3_plen_224_part_01